MNKIKVIEKNRNVIESDCKVWAKEISNTFRPDVIVFVAKSGFLFAKPLAEFFDVPMVDISICRPGNQEKDFIRKIVPKIPRWLLYGLLRCKANYGYQEKNNKRDVVLSERFLSLEWKRYKRILIVDDSADTGWSLVEAKKQVERFAKESQIKVLCYCVIDMSEKRTTVDWFRYRNTIVLSATSRYSKEYDDFIESLDEWMRRKTGE